jgi:hypothetical protein
MLIFAAEPPPLNSCPEAGAFGLSHATCDGSGSRRRGGIGNANAVIHPALIAEQHSRLTVYSDVRRACQQTACLAGDDLQVAGEIPGVSPQLRDGRSLTAGLSRVFTSGKSRVARFSPGQRPADKRCPASVNWTIDDCPITVQLNNFPAVHLPQQTNRPYRDT